MKKTDKKDALYVSQTLPEIFTKVLKREVTVELILPANYKLAEKKYPLLILNDGQDNEAMEILHTVDKLTRENVINEIIVAGVHAGDRLQEYGVSMKADFKKRGSVAKLYSKFLVNELIPYLCYQYPVSCSASDHASPRGASSSR